MDFYDLCFSDFGSLRPWPFHLVSNVEALNQMAARIAVDVEACLIACVTTSGYTARRVARERPNRPIIALTPNETSLRQLALVWGVTPLLIPDFDGTDEMLSVVSAALLDSGYTQPGDVIVVTAGLPAGGRGTTNLLKVHCIDEGPSRLHAASAERG